MKPAEFERMIRHEFRLLGWGERVTDADVSMLAAALFTMSPEEHETEGLAIAAACRGFIVGASSTSTR